MSKNIPCAISYGETKSQYFGGSVADEKGRKIGVEVSTRTRNITSREDGKSGYVAAAEDFGVMYGVTIQKTKDGKRWGASQRTHWFKTEDEAKAYWIGKVADRIAADWK